MKSLNPIVVSFGTASFLAAAAHGDGFTSTGNMGTDRYNHTATRLLDGKVLVVGGNAYDTSPGGSAELYDPASGTWTNTSSLEDPRVNHTATLLPNGKVLVAGGVNVTAYGPFGVDPRLYNPTNGTWSYPGGAGGHYYGHTATLLPGGKVLIVGGNLDLGAGFHVTRTAMLYDSATNSSVYTGNLGTARAFHTATLLPNGKVLVAGGWGTNGTLTSAELFNPATGTWTPTGGLDPAQSVDTATLLPNGKVLVVGGTSAEVYNPASGTWSPAGNPAASGSATLLPNGKVLVAGEIYGQSGLYTPSAELYDPAAGTWSAAGSPAAPRSGHTATLLSNGKVLLAGGFYNSAELYVSSLNPIVNPTRLSDGSFQFRFSNPSGPTYRVLASTILTAPLNTWSNLGAATEAPAGSGQFQFTDSMATNYPQRFYRVSWP
jgi:N-acetylneuraminic acid mutarotase